MLYAAISLSSRAIEKCRTNQRPGITEVSTVHFPIDRCSGSGRIPSAAYVPLSHSTDRHRDSKTFVGAQRHTHFLTM